MLYVHSESMNLTENQCEDETFLEERNMAFTSRICVNDYYILYINHEYHLSTSDDFWDYSDYLAHKDLPDLIDYGNYLEYRAYYNGFEDNSIMLYPISQTKFADLSAKCDKSDFSPSIVIANEIAQYTFNGTTEEEVLISWKN